MSPMSDPMSDQRMTCRFDAHIIASEKTFAQVALYEILARHQAAPVSAPA